VGRPPFFGSCAERTQCRRSTSMNQLPFGTELGRGIKAGLKRDKILSARRPKFFFNPRANGFSALSPISWVAKFLCCCYNGQASLIAYPDGFFPAAIVLTFLQLGVRSFSRHRQAPAALVGESTMKNRCDSARFLIAGYFFRPPNGPCLLFMIFTVLFCGRSVQAQLPTGIGW